MRVQISNLERGRCEIESIVVNVEMHSTTIMAFWSEMRLRPCNNEQPTSPADQKLRDLESIHIILPKEELSWEYIRTHKDIGAIFANKKS